MIFNFIFYYYSKHPSIKGVHISLSILNLIYCVVQLNDITVFYEQKLKSYLSLMKEANHKKIKSLLFFS